MKGRNSSGKFAKGNPGGPGRPRRAVELDYLRALNQTVTLEDWQEIVKVAITQAKSGDGKARNWLANYLLGMQPPDLSELLAIDAVDPAGPDKPTLDATINLLGDPDANLDCTDYDGSLRRQARRKLAAYQDHAERTGAPDGSSEQIGE